MSMEHGACSMEHGARRMEHGTWSMEHGGPISEYPVKWSGQSFSPVGRLEVARGPSRSWPVLANPG